MIDTGGSVTTAAMDLCIKPGQKNNLHRFGSCIYRRLCTCRKSSRREAVLDANMPKVNDVNGEKLKTTPECICLKMD